MANQDDVRAIALALPGAAESGERFAFSVDNNGKAKGFVWAWNERVHPKKPRVPRADVVAIRVADETEKQLLIAGDPDKFFTEPHYNGFPAVLVRLPAVTRAELRKLIGDAFRLQAPKPKPAVTDTAARARRSRPGSAPTTARPARAPRSSKPRPRGRRSR